MAKRPLSPEETRLWALVARSVRRRTHAPLVTLTEPAVIAPVPKEKKPPPSKPVKPVKPVKAAPILAEPEDLARLKIGVKSVQSTGQNFGQKSAAKPNLAMLADAKPDLSGHRKVRRGKVPIDARIDLHGLNQIDAQRELSAFIEAMGKRGFGCVLVITGKGRTPKLVQGDFMEPLPGVLRRRLPSWLAHDGINRFIAGYAPAHARHGGEGAFYVMLRKGA